MNDEKKFLIVDIFCTTISIVATIGFGYLFNPVFRRLMPANASAFKKLAFWLAEAVAVGGAGILSEKVVQMTVLDGLKEMDTTIKQIRQLAS